MNDYLFNPYEVLLHKRTHHTNMDVPYCRYISGTTFPTQHSELLNTTVTLKYRDYHIIDDERDEDTYIPVGRPMDDDDTYLLHQVGPEDFDEHRIYHEGFRVVRADSSEPFVLIGISEDYSKVIINSTRIDPNTGDYEFKDKISTWALQDNNFFGLEIKDKHTGEVDELEAVSIQVDDGDPCHSIMVEFLGSTNMIRLVLGDECLSRIQDYYDDSFNFDGLNSEEGEYDNWLDVDGYYASHRGIIVKDVDGGRAYNLERLFFNRHAGEDVPDEYEPMPYDEEIKYEFGDLDDPEKPSIEASFDFGDEDIAPVPEEVDDGEFDFGDYEPEDTDYDFGDIDTDVPSEAGPDYDFGDQDIDPVSGEDDTEFIFPDQDVILLDDGYLYEFGESGIEFTNPEEGDFNFGDDGEDIHGDDDEAFAFEDIDIEAAKLEDPYEFGDLSVDYIDAEGEFDFGDIDEIGVIDDDDDELYNFGDLDWIDPVPEPPEPEPEPIVRKYIPLPELKEEEIINFRRMIFERKVIYGSV